MIDLVLIAHLPKAGGTTIRKWLEKHLNTKTSLLEAYSAPIYRGLSPFVGKRLDRSLFISEIRNRGVVRVAIGHKVFPDAFPQAKLITIARHPIDLLTSKFNDYRSHIMREVKSGKLYECSDAGFLEWFKDTNPQSGILQHYNGINIDRIDYIMHTPELNQDIAWLAQFLGIPNDATPRNTAQVNLGMYRQDVYRMQPEIAEEFLETKAIGQCVYNQLMRRRDEIRNAHNLFLR